MNARHNAKVQWSYWAIMMFKHRKGNMLPIDVSFRLRAGCCQHFLHKRFISIRGGQFACCD
eukprot:scaffold484547_cov15-Prasinocladus_malaysianus.AAC.1